MIYSVREMLVRARMNKKYVWLALGGSIYDDAMPQRAFRESPTVAPGRVLRSGATAGRLLHSTSVPVFLPLHTSTIGEGRPKAETRPAP